MKKKDNLESLKIFFKENWSNLPNEIQIDPATKITNVKGFLNKNIKLVQANSGNRAFLPYFLRLVRIKNIILEQKNK